MSDTILRGGGIYGAAVSTVKNVILKFLEQENKAKLVYFRIASNS